MYADEVDLAAAKNCDRQGPFACVGGASSVGQVATLVPHQQGSGLPEPGATQWLSRMHAYRAQHLRRSASDPRPAQMELGSKQLPVVPAPPHWSIVSLHRSGSPAATPNEH